MSAAHSHLGASSSYRWIACPGSVRLASNMPNESSEYAREGTLAHAVAELCLREGRDAADCIGMSGPDFGLVDVQLSVTEEMAEHVQTYLDWAREVINAEECEWEIEVRFDLSKLYDGMFGTADLVVYRPKSGKLIVADYKHGRGVPVGVDGNPQLRYYALGAATRHHNRVVDSVEIAVIQPRCPHPKGPIRSEIVTPMELLDWSADLIAAARRTESADAPLVPGEHCKFCPASPVCPARERLVLESAQAAFSDTGTLEIAPVDSYDADRIAKLLGVVDQIEAWCKSLRDFAHHESEAGRTPPGWKLVATRPARKFKDWATVESLLVDVHGVAEAAVFTEPKPKSPAQIEATLKEHGWKAKDAKNLIAPYVESVSNGTVLAPLEDTRPAVRASAEAAFASVE